jgi:5-(carboxyamino)imidazole ribonucleotide synthase
MINLLGDVWFDSKGTMRLPDWAAVLALPGIHLHLYGKTEARKARKMGTSMSRVFLGKTFAVWP